MWRCRAKQLPIICRKRRPLLSNGSIEGAPEHLAPAILLGESALPIEYKRLSGVSVRGEAKSLSPAPSVSLDTKA